MKLAARLLREHWLFILGVLLGLGGSFIWPAGCAAATLGLHLGTAHSRSGFNGVNPGLYVRTDNGLTFGAFRNSYGDPSAYAAMTLETRDRRFALTAGVVTGYPGPALSPLVVPSTRIPLGRHAVRLSLIPKPPKHASSAGAHLSLETEF
jgi:hypothetical protein